MEVTANNIPRGPSSPALALPCPALPCPPGPALTLAVDVERILQLLRVCGDVDGDVHEVLVAARHRPALAAHHLRAAVAAKHVVDQERLLRPVGRAPGASRVSGVRCRQNMGVLMVMQHPATSMR
jgi:hypothetical protein